MIILLSYTDLVQALLSLDPEWVALSLGQMQKYPWRSYTWTRPLHFIIEENWMLVTQK